MSAFDKFKTDPKLETGGVWLDFGDFEIKVARAGGKNEKYLKRLDEVFTPHRKALEIKAMPEDKAFDALVKVYVDTIILDWRTKIDGTDDYEATMEDEDGTKLVYSRDNALNFFRKLPELFMQIRKHAEEWQNFRMSLREEAAKN
jgi:hypothetical protein